MQREVRDESLRAERQADRFAVIAQLEAIDEIESDVAHGGCRVRRRPRSASRPRTPFVIASLVEFAASYKAATEPRLTDAGRRRTVGGDRAICAVRRKCRRISGDFGRSHNVRSKVGENRQCALGGFDSRLGHLMRSHPGSGSS